MKYAFTSKILWISKQEFAIYRSMPVDAEKYIRVRQIVATENITRHGVSFGVLGGYIEDESCLAQDGDCWIGNGCIVFSDSHISGNALVENPQYVNRQSFIYNHCHIRGNAVVSGFFSIHDDVSIEDETTINVSDLSVIYSGCKFRGGAIMSGKIKIKNSLISGHPVINGPNNMGKVFNRKLICDNATINGNILIDGRVVVKNSKIKDGIILANKPTGASENDILICQDKSLCGYGKIDTNEKALLIQKHILSQTYSHLLLNASKHNGMLIKDIL